MIKTAESVSPLHPDKLCDFISDSLLDALMDQDVHSRVAIETMGGHGEIKITGEVTSNAMINYEKIIRDIVGEKYKIDINIVEQSREIANGVDVGGAGDQGIMVGYACNENPSLIPHELYLARDLCKYVFSILPFDGKTQITLDDNGDIIVCVCSFSNASTDFISEIVYKWLSNQKVNKDYKLFINPAGDWYQSGFDADAGVTGRKLIVDNYGPQIPIGGGAFSGKDITKVDRSGAYAARHIAVNLLKIHEAKEVIVKLAYAIGVIEPVMITAIIDGETIDLDPNEYSVNSIKSNLNLYSVKYAETAKWGAFGNGFNWDK